MGRKTVRKGESMQNRDDVVGGILLILIGIGVVIESIRLQVGTPLMPQPGFFPFLFGLLLIGLSIILLIQGWFGRGKSSQQTQVATFGELRPPMILVVSMIVYTAVLEPLGYVLPTIAISAVILRVMGLTSWKAISLTSLSLSLGTYILFGRILGIDLPLGILPFLG
jgi:putative tricarboxylic transport membrane protein